jgi:hypothetical protein
MSEPRECPMCRGEEIYFSEGDTHRWMNVSCHCGIKFEVAKTNSSLPAGHSVNTAGAIEQWNTRAPGPQRGNIVGQDASGQSAMGNI